MGILSRFSDILSANINALLDKAEDPGKMVDQYLRNMTDQLAEVKKETAGVMAEESRTQRLVDDNAKEVSKYADLAKKALMAGNEDDARVFLQKKQELEANGAGLHTAYAAAHENAVKMRQMHDKLVSDINSLNSRKQTIEAKVSVANAQKAINKVGASTESAQAAVSAFERMEDKADRMLDQANAMAELNTQAMDDAQALEEKYKGGGSASVEDELSALKSQLGLSE